MKRLRDYQHPVVAYAVRNRGAALFLEMRLGKTLCAIRAIQHARPAMKTRQRVLVVMPYAAFDGWIRELRSEGLCCVILSESRQQRLRQLATASRCKGDVYVLANKEAHLALPELAAQSWDVVVLDESTFIKNPKSKVSRFFTSQKMLRVRRRMILTGSPAPESLLDLFQQMKFVRGIFCGCRNYYQFRTRFFETEDVHKWVPKEGSEAYIIEQVALNSYSLQRKDVTLVERKIYETRGVKMPKELAQIYKSLERDFYYTYAGQEFETKHSIARFSELRKLANGFVNDEFVFNHKVETLNELLTTELVKQQVIVWVHFQEVARMLHKMLKQSVLYYGAQARLERQQGYQDFYSGKARILIASIQCAQFSLLLDNCETCIYFDRPLALIDRLQSEARMVNVTRQTPLLYIDLFTERTVDAATYHLSKSKSRKFITMRDILSDMRERVQ